MSAAVYAPPRFAPLPGKAKTPLWREIAAELADVSMELGNHEVALKALRAVTLMKNPAPMSRAQAFLKQGVIASSQGDAKKAVFLARKALSEDPTLEDAQRFLAQIVAE